MNDVHNTVTYKSACQRANIQEWRELEFFSSGQASRIAARVDQRRVEGAQVLPAPDEIFAALELTPPHSVRAIILGQDPYPTPGDAHGLAFSVANRDQRLPASLKTIYDSLKQDLGVLPPAHGNLTQWAKSGVLLLNAALTVEQGKPNSHKDFGWDELAMQVLMHLNAASNPIIFMLWGKFAQKTAPKLNEDHHCVIRCPHPSPLAHGGGPVHGFVSAQPFAQAKNWCLMRGLDPIDWSL